MLVRIKSMRIFLFYSMALTFNEFLSGSDINDTHYLLIGNPVKHSYSPLMHNKALSYYNLQGSYVAVQLLPEQIGRFAAHLNHRNFKGANITIPYKHEFMEVVDQVSPEALEIGAINTIYKRGEKVLGDNTDWTGFLEPIKPYRDVLEGERAVIFGTGGATKAIIFALQQIGMQEIILVSRNPERRRIKDDQIGICSYQNWQVYAEDAALLVNATPLGMSPNIDESPVRDGEVELLKDKFCYDIVYNPLKTRYLKQAVLNGGVAIEGLDMLIGQGSKSFELWTGNPFPEEIIKTELMNVI